MNAIATDAPVIYHVRLQDRAARLFEISAQIAAPDPEGQLLSLASWIPGSYLIRDYARHVVAISATAAGETVGLRKLDKATWRAASVHGPLLVRMEVYANDLSVRGACIEVEHAFFNGVCLFLRVHGVEDERCVVHVDGPDGENDWELVTSLQRLTGTAREFGAFQAANYAELIDHPVLMGRLAHVEFEVAGVPHALSIAGRHAADLERLRQDLALVCATHLEFFGDPPPIDRYHFLLMLADGRYGGLEHRYSSALVCGHEDLPRTGMTGMPSGYQRFLGLVSHEYFHLWNVKRIRPSAFADASLQDEAYTRQLWVFEGITSYYDDLALLRSGLVGVDGYLELLGRSLTAVYRSRGRRRQTLEEASFDAWIKLYRPDENSPNATVSYYQKGAMVALALDLELRLKTGARCSLDDVMRLFWAEYGATGHPVPEGGFERLAEEASGVDLGEFFRQCLRSTVDPPVGILLAQFGVRLHLRAMESGTDAGGKPGQREQNPPAWLGIRTETRGDRLFVKHVLTDGPAIRAGLTAGDELLALDGWQIRADRFTALLERLAVDDQVTVHLFRHNELHEVQISAAQPPRDTCYLSIVDDADAAATERRERWLDARGQRAPGAGAGV